MPEATQTAPEAASSVSTTESTPSAAPATESAPASAGTSRNEKGQFQAAGKTREPVAKSKDAEDIYSRVRARLDKFNEAIREGDETETEPEAEAPAEEAEQPAAENKPDPAEAKADAEQPAADKPAQEAAAEVTPAPTLPAAHVRSLKAFGLSDEEIKNTPAAVAAALHARRNQEITRWAEQGRKQQAQTQTPPPVQVNPAPATPPPPAAPQGVDIAALKATYGENEPLIQKLAAQEQELAEFRQFRTSWQQQQEQARLAAVIRDVDGFFSAKEMAAHHATYGTATASLTPEQDAKRMEVLKLADAIVGGARQQGVELPIHEALQHAFDSVAAPAAKEAARQEIKAELQKRAKGVTLKPGGKPAPKPAVPAREELYAKTRAALRKTFT